MVAIKKKTKRKGRWKKGESGNPRGRPKADFKIREMAREKSAAMFKVLSDIAENEDNREADRIAAAKTILAYGYGTPPAMAPEGGQVVDPGTYVVQIAPKAPDDNTA